LTPKEDPIAGATLPALRWPSGFNPALDVLRRWVRTRHGMTLLSNMRRADVLTVVKKCLEVEAGLKEEHMG